MSVNINRYHNLRNGCLYGEDGLGYHHVMIFICLMENISLIFEILLSITPISIKTNNIATKQMKKKIGRNDMCPCAVEKNISFVVVNKVIVCLQ